MAGRYPDDASFLQDKERFDDIAPGREVIKPAVAAGHEDVKIR